MVHGDSIISATKKEDRMTSDETKMEKTLAIRENNHAIVGRTLYMMLIVIVMLLKRFGMFFFVVVIWTDEWSTTTRERDIETLNA